MADDSVRVFLDVLAGLALLLVLLDRFLLLSSAEEGLGDSSDDDAISKTDTGSGS